MFLGERWLFSNFYNFHDNCRTNFERSRFPVVVKLERNQKWFSNRNFSSDGILLSGKSESYPRTLIQPRLPLNLYYLRLRCISLSAYFTECFVGQYRQN